ncbi:uncharacterized protein LOC142979748 [Anticarsia gemmatalis]|uniref:uncharacterized protein LOC142979748 n=1 Tax=Anticarsia gemmatalis TaxID=129554 RepID=UPI003F75AE12
MHSINLPRTCLGFTNILFFVLGTIGFVICLWCAVNTDFFRDVNYTVTKSSVVDTIAKFINMKLWVTPVTMILIPITVLAMMTSCCGVLGAGCKIKCAIKSYIFLSTGLSAIAFWLFFITGIYNIYTNNDRTRNSMQVSLHEYYGKENDLITFVWNYIMINHECCGVVTYRDFYGSPWHKAHPGKLYPVQCCVLSNVTTLKPLSKDCTVSLGPDTLWHKSGCFLALQSAIIRNKGKIIFYIVLIGIMYFIVTLFAYCLIRGEPLLGSMAGKFTDFLPPKGRADAAKSNNNNIVVTPSNMSLGNVMYNTTEHHPKRVVKVVSAANPFQSYSFTPNAYGQETMRPYPQSYRY